MSSAAEYIHGDISREEYIESVRSENMKSRIDRILERKNDNERKDGEN